ncbi:MAG: D-alanine--D-alanine ligase [Actinobacteria bacterium]|nr:D-alanine--D-alanine ligase [Actinomycetota bacterium]
MSTSSERIRLVVLFGGRSAEHDISRVSASHVMSAVDPERYEVVPVGITRSGEWRLAERAAELLGTGAELPPAIDVEGRTIDPLGPGALLPDIAPPSRQVSGPVSGNGDDSPVTVVFPVLHGPNGEDGTVQGLLEMTDVPYVGAGVLGSAVAMDKAMAKTVLDAAGIPQPRWRSITTDDLRSAGLVGDLLDELGPVVFVKPANMGSSIGVSRAADAAELDAALADAARYDEQIVVEECIGTADERVRELECGVIGNRSPRASTVGEIVPAAEFYDYDDKYRDGAARTVIPAELSDGVAEHVRDLAVRTFAALRAEGLARVDMFLAPDGRVLVNEINTMPGFTPISMFPQLWAASGLPYRELVDELVGLAIERHVRRSRFETGR